MKPGTWVRAVGAVCEWLDENWMLLLAMIFGLWFGYFIFPMIIAELAG